MGVVGCGSSFLRFSARTARGVDVGAGVGEGWAHFCVRCVGDVGDAISDARGLFLGLPCLLVGGEDCVS